MNALLDSENEEPDEQTTVDSNCDIATMRDVVALYWSSPH